MKQTKSGVSSLLKEDFGIEDFVAGNYTSHNSSAFGLEDVALANQLGLLASFKDYDTTSDTFSMEAYNLLGESDQIGLFAAQGMENAANQFSVLANIKKEFGVEGFDPLTYGAEGFTDTVKKAWSWLVAAFKKLIQSVSNFIRGVMNFVGGIVAKTQSGLVDKYKNLKATDPSKGKTIKGMIPVKGLSNALSEFNKGIAAGVKDIELQVTHLRNGFEVSNAGSPNGEGMKINSFADNPKELRKRIVKYLKISKSENKFINAFDKNPGLAAKIVVFGEAGLAPIEHKCIDYLSDGEWKTVLSKDFLGKMKEFVSDGKRLIKMFQTALKEIDSIQKNAVILTNAANKIEANAKDTKAAKDSYKKKAKSTANDLKKVRRAISELTHYRNISGKLTGLLYGIYANCLKARSYYAAAVRSYASDTKASNKDKNKKIAKDDAAFRERNNLN